MSKSKTAREAMYIERLEQVVRVLKELPKTNKFDLGYWALKDFSDYQATGVKASCDTTACAVGWAASDPWFNKRGFTLSLERSLREGEEVELVPLYRYSSDSYASVQDFFGINEEEKDYLFMPRTYTRGSRSDVWRRIEKYIKRRKEGFRIVYFNGCSGEPVWKKGRIV